MNRYGTGWPPGGMLKEFPLTLSAGSNTIIRPTIRQVYSVIVSVETGLLDLFRGESPAGIPWRCVPERPYQWFLPPSDQYVFCVLAVQDVVASVCLLGV